MTKGKKHKRAIRQRMARTGESYTSAKIARAGTFERAVHDVVHAAEHWRNGDQTLHEELRLDGDSVDEVLEQLGRRSPEEQALKQLLEQLPDPFVYRLQTLMYWGRDYNFGEADLAALHRHLRVQTPNAADAIRTMLEKVPLAEYLRKGLALARSQSVDLEKPF